MSALDGLTLLRYGHTYDSGGGIEQYLADLNRTLLARNQVTTIQVQLTSDRARVGETTEGRLRRVALFVDQRAHERAVAGTGDDSGAWYEFKKALRTQVLFRSWIYRVLTGPILSLRKVPKRLGEPDGAGEAVRRLHASHRVDLICLHSAGGADVQEILAVAKAARIPVAYVHHFSNDRLDSFAMRPQLDRMARVAGVCGVDVPAYLQAVFENVSDGIDTDFFQLTEAERAARQTGAPVIFLPARITPAKGQADLLRAAGELKRRGLDFRVALAGRTDSPAFVDELRAIMAREGITDRVDFVGQLGPAGLRTQYAAAAVVAFPTRHHEGLPRILLECQAMEVPPVVHRIGGTAEGVREGQTGYVIEVGDFAGLVERLASLLQDAALRARLGAAGRRLAVERFSLPALAARHEQFYRRVLAAGAP